MPAVPPEVTLEQYQLRSTFFAEKIGVFGFFDFEKKINKLVADQEHLFTWNDRSNWGINEAAWKDLATNNLSPLKVFCHPRIVQQHPSLIRYYRSIALLPQKGMQAISTVSSIKEIEDGLKEVPSNKVINVVVTLNELMSSIISLTPGFNSEKITGMMYATAGTTIDGSWRNQIGTEGERVIRSLLVKALYENKEIAAILDKSDTSFTLTEWNQKYGDPSTTVTNVKSIIVRNGASMYFSSEPDVTFADSNGTIKGAIEIKAGIDPAGALERLGAMFKSFDNVLSTSPDAKTILVASCITPEVETRLRETNTVSQTFITTDLINNKSGRGLKFTNSARSIMGLIDSRF